MIRSGSMAVIKTDEAVYSPCRVISINKDNVTVTFFAGFKKDKKTGKIYEDRPVETISRKKILSMSERI